MIYGYEIKKIYNEEILYLYVDFDQELATMNNKKRKEKLSNLVADYVKKNKISFKGATVALLAGGMVIGCVVLKNPVIDNGITDNHYIAAIINHDEPQSPVKEETIIIPQEEKKEEKKEEKVVTKKQTKTKVEVKQEEDIKDNNQTYITIKRSNGLITSIEMEEYVIGVVGAEMPASFNEEALKAQAVIARTYAVSVLNKGKILTDTSSTQNYKDNNELKKLWGSDYNKYYNKIKSAVNSTKGIYLTYNGKIIDAVYHSTSNGKTESAEYVWSNSKPYLISVDSPYDTSNKSFSFDKYISYSDLTKLFKMEINQDTEFNIISKTPGDRVNKIVINKKEYTGVEVRTILSLRSADFEVIKDDNGITFRTKGYGHGVGMSQYGANGMAKAGYNYQEILKHYYKGVKLTAL